MTMSKYKYFLFSDPHGCFEELRSSLEKAGFKEDNNNHIMVGLGDYFDRGSQSSEIYDFLTNKKFKERVYLVRGNHDEMLINFFETDGKGSTYFNCAFNGMSRTIESFSKINLNYQLLNIMPEHYIALINENYPDLHSWLTMTLKDGFQIDNYILTHAGLKHQIVIDENSEEETEEWIIDTWNITPNFVKYYNKENDNFKYVFGHWHAERLREDFGYETSAETFIHNNGKFIGLDAATNVSGFVNVYIIESDQLPKELKI